MEKNSKSSKFMDKETLNPLAVAFLNGESQDDTVYKECEKIMNYVAWKYRLGGDANADIREDLLMKAFLKVLASKDSFDPAQSFHGWFRLICENLCKDFLYSQANDVTVLAEEEQDMDAFYGSKAYVSAEKVFFSKKIREIIMSMIPETPKERRAVFFSCFFEGYRNREAARKYNVPETTVNNWFHRDIEAVASLGLSPEDIQGDLEPVMEL